MKAGVRSLARTIGRNGNNAIYVSLFAPEIQLSIIVACAGITRRRCSVQLPAALGHASPAITGLSGIGNASSCPTRSGRMLFDTLRSNPDTFVIVVVDGL